MLGNLGFSDFTWAHVRMCHEMLQALDQRAWKTKTWRSKPGPALLCVYVDVWWCFFPQVDAQFFNSISSHPSPDPRVSTEKNIKKNYKSNRNSSPGLTLLFPTAQPQRSLLHILKNSIGMKSMKSWKRWNPSLDQDTRAVRGGLRKKTTKQSRGWDVLDSAAQHVMRLPLISLESKHKSTNLL